LGLVGHGFGSRAALLVAMRNSGIRAFVSLDGDIGKRGGTAGLEHAAGFNPGGVKAAVLHIYQSQDSTGAPDFTLLSSLGSRELWRATTSYMHHNHFSTLGAASTAFPAVGTASGASQLTASDFGAVLRLTFSFFDAFLKSTPEPFRKEPALPVAHIVASN
jgi:hypothetical protein